ncbi:MAG: uroporphyrinogen decarboxylase family protein [Candidatus Neomarinimicrobiota bacterium]
MNGRQRLNSALRGGQPDRVPVWCLLSIGHIIRNGTPTGEIPRVIEEYIEAECNCTRNYGFDGVLLYLPGTQAGTEVHDLLDLWINGAPQGAANHDFDSADPLAWPSEMTRYDESNFYSSHLARSLLGMDYHLGGWAADGFSRAIQWFPNLEDALIATLQDPGKFKALVDYFDQQSITWARAQVELGRLESIQISSPYSGAMFLSLPAYRELVFDSVRKLAREVQAGGGIAYLHTCGNITDRLELFVETGVDGIECMDPPPLGDTTLREAKEQVGDRIALKGNIDSVNVLLRGDADLVDRTIRETLSIGKPGGGYVLSTACSVAPAVKPERVRRLFEIAAEIGNYC